jgi:hypothetical protein
MVNPLITDPCSLRCPHICRETFPGDCNHDVHKMTHSAESERFGLYGCSIFLHVVGSLKMNTALEYSTRVVQEGYRRCKKSTLNDLAYLTPLRIPLMNPVMVAKSYTIWGRASYKIWGNAQIFSHTAYEEAVMTLQLLPSEFPYI